MLTNDTTGPSANRRRQTVGEVIRFGLVGGTATLLQYGAYWLLLHWLAPTLAMTVAYAITLRSTSTPRPGSRSA